MKTGTTRRDVRTIVARCAERMESSARMAAVLGGGPDPEDGAEQLVLAYDALEDDVRQLRSIVRERGA